MSESSLDKTLPLCYTAQRTDVHRRKRSGMTKPWDEMMKKLIDASPQELLDWLANGVKFLHFVPTELLKANEEEEPLRADRYLVVEEDEEQGIVHLEIQSGPD